MQQIVKEKTYPQNLQNINWGSVLDLVFVRNNSISEVKVIPNVHKTNKYPKNIRKITFKKRAMKRKNQLNKIKQTQETIYKLLKDFQNKKIEILIKNKDFNKLYKKVKNKSTETNGSYDTYGLIACLINRALSWIKIIIIIVKLKSWPVKLSKF